LENWLLILLGSVLILIVLTCILYAERGHLVLPSTLAALKASGPKNIINGKAIHGYYYGRWIPQYLAKLQRRFPKLSSQKKQEWGNNYHGKVLPHELAKAIITLDHEIAWQDLGEQVIPYSAAREIVLKLPLDIVVTECGCRATRKHPCQPSQVCMAIGKPFSEFILEHRPDKSRRIDQQEALRILEEVHAKGCVHHGYFKDVTLNRFYVICNCCKCCCTGIEAMTKYDIPMICSSGYVAVSDSNACIGCGTCEQTCAFHAIRVNASKKSEVDWAKCMGCGLCASKCPNHAVQLQLDPQKGKPLDV